MTSISAVILISYTAFGAAICWRCSTALHCLLGPVGSSLLSLKDLDPPPHSRREKPAGSAQRDVSRPPLIWHQCLHEYEYIYTCGILLVPEVWRQHSAFPHGKERAGKKKTGRDGELWRTPWPCLAGMRWRENKQQKTNHLFHDFDNNTEPCRVLFMSLFAGSGYTQKCMCESLHVLSMITVPGAVLDLQPPRTWLGRSSPPQFNGLFTEAHCHEGTGGGVSPGWLMSCSSAICRCAVCCYTLLLCLFPKMAFGAHVLAHYWQKCHFCTLFHWLPSTVCIQHRWVEFEPLQGQGVSFLLVEP